MNLSSNKSERLLRTIKIEAVSRVLESGWLTKAPIIPDTNRASVPAYEGTVSKHLSLWQKEIKLQLTKAKDSAEGPIEIPEFVRTMDITHKLVATDISKVISMKNLQRQSGRECLTDLLDNFANHGNLPLNQKQRFVFEIIITRIFRRSRGEPLEAIRLLLLGEAGSGKTEALKRAKLLLSHCRMTNTIRVAAYTGNAASLIDGTTIHSGHSIKVFSSAKSKTIMDSENPSVELTINEKQKLRDTWKPALAQVFDEASIIPPELLCDVDVNNRIAKESDELFGGIDTYFIADFYQYPPVAAASLYEPISGQGGHQAAIVKRKVGRYLWLNLQYVIEFDQQYRQRADPELGRAIQNLRKNKCDAQDLALFNSRVIKTAISTQGIDMSLGRGPSAVVITKENIPRIVLNEQKVRSICEVSDLTLIQCWANDQIVGGSTLPERLRNQLLELDGLGAARNEELQSLLTFYEGCPVILRHKNLATELRISKGTQGVLKKVFLNTLCEGKQYAEAVIVHFETSPVQLTGLQEAIF